MPSEREYVQVLPAFSSNFPGNYEHHLDLAENASSEVEILQIVNEGIRSCYGAWRDNDGYRTAYYQIQGDRYLGPAI